MHKKTRWVVFIALFLTVFLAATPIAGAAGSDTFEEILNYVQKMHISNPQVEELYDGAINGLIDTLNDPYTLYMKPDELDEFKNSIEGTIVGVGIELVTGESYPAVIWVIKGSPAESAGIVVGDIITKVDGNDIAKESLPNIVQKIKGPVGTKVRLTIRRNGVDDFDIQLRRSNINLPTVQGELLENGIGYIKIDIFGSSTAGDFRDSLAALKEKGAKKLILDLRDDPGGYVQAAVEITGNFVEKDKTVVSIVDHNNTRSSFYADGDMIARGMPVAVLVNSGSASASEIVAGALQDYGAATLIGEKTFGKGTVQTVIPLTAGGALKLTTARYHTPNDRVIDHTGLEPDIQVLTPELQLAVAKSWLNSPDKTRVTLEVGGSETVVDGSAIKFSQAPFSQGDIIYLPLRVVFEALGCRVDWQSSDGSVKVTDPQSEVVFYPGEGGRILSGGQAVTGIEPLVYKNGVYYLPVSSLKFFDLRVEVDNGRITIEK